MIKTLIWNALVYSQIFDIKPFSQFKTKLFSLKYKTPSDLVTQHGCLLTQLHINKDASISIGNHVQFGYRTSVDYSGGLIIGNDVALSPDVKVYTHKHPIRKLSENWFSDLIEYTPLEIGNNVWIGANAIILPNVRKIGEGAVIGAGSVVTKEVDNFTIIAGNPARIISIRD